MLSHFARCTVLCSVALSDARFCPLSGRHGVLDTRETVPTCRRIPWTLVNMLHSWQAGVLSLHTMHTTASGYWYLPPS